MNPCEATYDVIGVGFGPSNLALAIALDEAVRLHSSKCRFHFIEKQEASAWHGGMLLSESNMQISFLKDLVSLRDPTSPFTFINYLHEKKRLEDFINQKTFFPSRIEFNSYLCWAAAHFEDCCTYGETVIAIEPEVSRGTVICLRVRSCSAGVERVYRARNLVLAVGGSPHVPAAFADLGEDTRVFHSSRYLDGIARLGIEDRPSACIAVIGGGQSTAEIFLDLHSRFSNVRTEMIIRGNAIKPADDSPFVNEIFNPQFTDLIFNQPERRRRDTLREFRNTNYGVVDIDLIHKIYGIFYQQKVTGNHRHALLRTREITRAASSSEGIELTLVDSIAGTCEVRTYEAVILATGYERNGGRRLLAGLASYLPELSLDRDYRLCTKRDFLPSIYIQGCSEATHGLSDTLLSVLAVRAQEIANALLDSLSWQRTVISAHEVLGRAVRIAVSSP